MSRPRLKLGLAQMTSTDTLEDNLEKTETAITEGQKLGAEVLVFPENTLYFRLRSGVPVQGVRPDGPELARLKKLVDQGSMHVLLTTAVEGKSDRLDNATIWLAPKAQPKVVYTKIHLFDVDVEGAPPVRESETFVPGSGPEVIEIGGWKFGLSVCYDLRFSELYHRYAQKVDVILVPSAFLVPTGEAHWHVLLRARAIENQCFVAAPAQAGEHVSSSGSKRHTYGHSLVVDPWGRVLMDKEKGTGVDVIELDAGLISGVRRQIPMAGHRRL